MLQTSAKHPLEQKTVSSVVLIIDGELLMALRFVLACVSTARTLKSRFLIKSHRVVVPVHKLPRGNVKFRFQSGCTFPYTDFLVLLFSLGVNMGHRSSKLHTEL